MKSLFAAIIIAAVIITGGIMCSSSVEKLSDELCEKNEKILELIDVSEYDEASRLTKEIEDRIKDSSVLLASYIDHDEIDKIEAGIAELKVYLKEQDKSPALANANVLKELLEHLPRDYRVKPENIF